MREKVDKFEVGRSYTATEVSEVMRCSRETVQQAREAGLLPMYKLGKGWFVEGSQAIQTLNKWAEMGLDLSSPERIILAGQNLRKKARA